MSNRPAIARVYNNLTARVLIAIAIGALIGWLKPQWGAALEPLGKGFIRLVTMVVGPIIFLTIVVGIASMGDLKKIGRVGGKALLYFEVVTTLALAIGLLVGNIARPGAGIDTRAQLAKETQSIEPYKQRADEQSTTQFLLNVIPESVVGAFAKGDLLQILFFAVLFGIATAALGPHTAGLVRGMETLIEVMFRIVRIVMIVAPIGALGAMAFTVGKYGIASLLPLIKLMLCVYLTMALFIFVVLGTICRAFGFSIFRFILFIKEEILLVLGTSSSESALPRLIEKLEIFGCSRAVVGMVVPAGYSFNLDGTSIYLSTAVLFIAQAYGIHLGLKQQLFAMGVLMLTSKGAAGVTGAGFVTLTATLGATKILPIEGVALLLGVDRFMSEARAITNLIGNGVATVVVSKMEGEFDVARYHAAISGRDPLKSTCVSSEIAADIARDGAMQ